MKYLNKIIVFLNLVIVELFVIILLITNSSIDPIQVLNGNYSYTEEVTLVETGTIKRSDFESYIFYDSYAIKVSDEIDSITIDYKPLIGSVISYKNNGDYEYSGRVETVDEVDDGYLVTLDTYTNYKIVATLDDYNVNIFYELISNTKKARIISDKQYIDLYFDYYEYDEVNRLYYIYFDMQFITSFIYAGSVQRIRVLYYYYSLTYYLDTKLIKETSNYTTIVLTTYKIVDGIEITEDVTMSVISIVDGYVLVEDNNYVYNQFLIYDIYKIME